MRQNDDGKTVAAADMLVPGIGELIGGSQREERLDVLDGPHQRAGHGPRGLLSGTSTCAAIGSVPSMPATAWALSVC